MSLPFKEDDDFRKHNQNAEASSKKDLKEFFADFEALEAQKKDIGKEQSDLVTVMKSRGYNVKALKRALAERKRDAAELQEEKDVTQLYLDILT